MKVEQVMSKNVATCFPEDTVQDAATLMKAYGTGCLIVLEGGEMFQVLGVITDRDVCLALGRTDRRPSDLEVRSVMSSPAHCCRPDDALWEILAMAETYRVRRFPVIDSGGQILGVVSLDDAARQAARHSTGVPALGARDVCRAIAMCSEGRGAGSPRLEG
ncbi:MAG: CBS domain-containing protein [Myxococcota bacterium]